MFQWANFEAAAPLLAAHGRELIERFRFVLVGTIRSDGTPRISPVEAHIVRGHLMLVMIPGTLKARDLLRDRAFSSTRQFPTRMTPIRSLSYEGGWLRSEIKHCERRLLTQLRRRADGDRQQAGTSFPSTSRRPPSSPGRVGC